MAHDQRDNPAQKPIPSLTLAIGLVGIVTALAASLALSLRAAGALSLPGCGLASPCDRLAAGLWGTIPVIGLPISIVGAAYFSGLTLWLFTARRTGIDRITRWPLRTGAAISLLLLVVMLVQEVLCGYCLAAHAGHLLFIIAIDLTRRSSAPPHITAASQLWPGVLTGFLTLIILAALWNSSKHSAHTAGREALAHSTNKIIAESNSPSPQPAGSAPFRGRYPRGPAAARVRIVLFSDFQCEECRRIEAEALVLAADLHGDVQVSIKHFPLCAECNRAATTSPHRSACNAALAAEAAGAIGGVDAFWRAAQWIFGREGDFTTDDFLNVASSWGLDKDTLRAALADPATMALVKTDVEEGLRLGVSRTPSIYINGVELRGWETPGALDRAVSAILASDAAAALGDADHPLDAEAKAISDWQSGPTVIIPPRDPAASSTPAAEPSVRIVLFGDYQDRFTTEADGIIRQYIATWPGTIYEYRHFPASTACNPRLPQNLHPLACRMARAAEAARILGGLPAFERIHAWLQEHQQDFSDAGLRQLAAELSLDPTLFIAAQKDTRVQAILQADIDAGNNAGVNALPSIYINGRLAPVWKTEQGELLTRMLDLAAGEHPARPQDSTGDSLPLPRSKTPK